MFLLSSRMLALLYAFRYADGSQDAMCHQVK